MDRNQLAPPTGIVPRSWGYEEPQGDENEEPEEQEGAWVITRSELLGERLADKTQVAAQLVDAAMRPTQALALWSVQARPAQHSPYP